MAMLYHGTALDNLIQIAKLGLMPRLAKWHEENRPGEAFPAVYLSPDERFASTYGASGGETRATLRARGFLKASNRKAWERLNDHDRRVLLKAAAMTSTPIGKFLTQPLMAVAFEHPDVASSKSVQGAKGAYHNLAHEIQDSVSDRNRLGNVRAPYAILSVKPDDVRDAISEVSVREVNQALEKIKVSVPWYPQGSPPHFAKTAEEIQRSFPKARDRAVAFLKAGLPFAGQEIALDKPVPPGKIQGRLARISLPMHMVPKGGSPTGAYRTKDVLEHMLKEPRPLARLVRLAAHLKYPLVALGLATGLGSLLETSDDTSGT